MKHIILPIVDKIGEEFLDGGRGGTYNNRVMNFQGEFPFRSMPKGAAGAVLGGLGAD